MKLLVCISKAPDTTSKISFTDSNTAFNEQGVQYIVNPYDEWYALVRALEIKESAGGNVTTITVGKEDVDPIIRKALAIGADDAVRINADAKDAYFVANQIAQYAKENSFDAILLGKETIDYNGSQLGAMLAEMLDLPFISLATKLDINGNTATVERDIQGGSEVLEVQTPFVLSAAKGLAEQRIPNMRGIMAARTKALKVVDAYAAEELTSIVAFNLPPAKGDCKYIDADNAAELINLLHTEAKII
jgi:electron transfer flavoprotein beta subunit